jgi:hypothetical protein
MKLINLTPHEIKLPNGTSIEPSGYVARANTHLQQCGEMDGIPLLKSLIHSVSNLPEPQDGHMFIVPAIVRSHLSERNDLLSPAKLIRNNQGHVIGCGAFEINAQA